MALTDSQVEQVLRFVKKEPRTVQEVSRLIGRSWVTTDSYLKQLKERTGLIDIKTFRKGSQAALKIVFYNFTESSTTDEMLENLYRQIRSGRRKTDFDFMEVFQYVPDKEKRSWLEEYRDEKVSQNQHIVSLFRQAESIVYCFSGNLSFIGITENKTRLISVIEELLKRKVRFKILCRVNVASLNNIHKLAPLMIKYPDFIEIRHSYQPLRGFIIDDKIARFKDEESLRLYKAGELPKNTRIFYEIYAKEWVSFLQKVFWNAFRFSLDHNTRLKEIKKIF